MWDRHTYNIQRSGQLFKLHFHHIKFSNSSSCRSTWPNANFTLVNLLQRQGRWWLEPQKGRERRAQAPLRTGAGQWWKVHMLQCHHKLHCKEWSGHKGVPKIGWNCSQSENKLPKFQYEQTMFLTCIFMWSLLGEARSTEMKYNMPWQWNLKLLFHLDTKMQRNLHEPGA